MSFANWKPICENSPMNKWYAALFEIGRLSGCHQLPERSFFYKGKQFPVCARCTGAFIGYISGGVLYRFWDAPVLLCVLFCAIMFFDWFVQRINLLESTNFRRLITGILCGFGLMQIYARILTGIIETLVQT